MSTSNADRVALSVHYGFWMNQDTIEVRQARTAAKAQRLDPARQLPIRLRKRRRLERLNGRPSTMGGRKYRHRKYQWEETP